MKIIRFLVFLLLAVSCGIQLQGDDRPRDKRGRFEVSNRGNGNTGSAVQQNIQLREQEAEADTPPSEGMTDSSASGTPSTHGEDAFPQRRIVHVRRPTYFIEELRANYTKATKMLLVLTSLATKMDIDWETNGERWNGCWRDDVPEQGSALPSAWLLKATERMLNDFECLETFSERELLVKLFNVSYGMSLIASTIAVPSIEEIAIFSEVKKLYRFGYDEQVQSSWYGVVGAAVKGLFITQQPTNPTDYSLQEIGKIRAMMPQFFQVTTNMVSKFFYYTADVKSVNKKFRDKFYIKFIPYRLSAKAFALLGSSVELYVMHRIPEYVAESIEKIRTGGYLQNPLTVQWIEEHAKEIWQRGWKVPVVESVKTGNSASLLTDEAQALMNQLFLSMIQ